MVVCSAVYKQTHLFWILCKSWFISSCPFFLRNLVLFCRVTWYHSTGWATKK